METQKYIGVERRERTHGVRFDNVSSGVYYPQAWFPIAGYDLRAPRPS